MPRDAALDPAWVLHGASREFARASEAAYRPADEQWHRAMLWHRLSPWHAVEHGLQLGDRDEVRTGLDGLVRTGDGLNA